MPRMDEVDQQDEHTHLVQSRQGKFFRAVLGIFGILLCILIFALGIYAIYKF